MLLPPPVEEPEPDAIPVEAVVKKAMSFFQKDMQRRPMYRDPVEEESHLTSAPMKEQKTPNFMPTTAASSSHVNKPKRREKNQQTNDIFNHNLTTTRSLSNSSFIDLALEVEVAVVPQRNVTFATTVELRFGISVKDMTADEVLQTWMSTTEHNMVRKSCLKIIDAVEKFGGNPRTGKKLCVRGLEPHFTKQAKQNTINRKTTRQAVLSKCDDDYCNQDNGDYDMDLIKEAYQVVGRTSEFQFSAELKAIQDRKEIEKYLFVLETTHPHLLQYPKYVPPPTSKSVSKNTQVKQNQNEHDNNTNKFPTKTVGSENNLYNAYSKGNVVPESAPLPKSESAAALAAAVAAAESAPSTKAAARRSSSSWTSALAPKSTPASTPASTSTSAPVVSTPVSASASTSTSVPASKSTSTSKSTSALVSALLAASKSAMKSKSGSNSNSNNCCTTTKMDFEYVDTENNANTDAKATFTTVGMEYEDDIKEENEEADTDFANNKKKDENNNNDIESERSIHISF